MAIIRVGAATEIEMIEKKHRVEDALEAVKSAQIEGILAGGSTFFIKQSASLFENVKDEALNEWQELGIKIVGAAIREPLRQMALNAGESPDLIIAEVLSSADDKGWNFLTNELFPQSKPQETCRQFQTISRRTIYLHTGTPRAI